MTRLFRAVREGSVAVVVEEVQMVERPLGADQDVQQAIAVEVIHDRSTGVLDGLQSSPPGHVWKVSDIVLGLEPFRLGQPLFGNILRPLAQLLVGDVHQPHRGVAPRIQLERLRVFADCPLGPTGHLVQAVAKDGKNA